MTIKNYLALILSASYWRYRRQRESHAMSAFWVKMVFALLFPMWGITIISLFFQTIDALQPFREKVSHAQTALLAVLWLAGGLSIDLYKLIHPFTP